MNFIWMYPIITILFYIAMAWIIYRAIKRMAKTWIKEALIEYEKDMRKENIMRKVEDVRNKYR